MTCDQPLDRFSVWMKFPDCSTGRKNPKTINFIELKRQRSVLRETGMTRICKAELWRGGGTQKKNYIYQHRDLSKPSAEYQLLHS